MTVGNSSNLGNHDSASLISFGSYRKLQQFGLIMIELATATKRENRLLLVISAIWDKSAIRALPDASRSR
ncbi:hypothetical protein [Moorena producens]|uniref:hypothetical protein n=1 Tax=Moorena producens TaxID=1155739 RepID=UPI0005CAB3FA|nr:hypothetical protein [Moorena producens]OLT65232.1 hypothetical protein BI334_09440 [Moorena producens 3L]